MKTINEIVSVRGMIRFPIADIAHESDDEQFKRGLEGLNNCVGKPYNENTFEELRYYSELVKTSEYSDREDVKMVNVHELEDIFKEYCFVEYLIKFAHKTKYTMADVSWMLNLLKSERVITDYTYLCVIDAVYMGDTCNDNNLIVLTGCVFEDLTCNTYIRNSFEIRQLLKPQPVGTDILKTVSYTINKLKKLFAEELMEHNDWNEETAMEWLEENVIFTNIYKSKDGKSVTIDPIVMTK